MLALFPLWRAARTSGKQSRLAATGDYPPSLRSPWRAAGEHALEVQLPFLQRTVGSFEMVPFIVGEATPEEVAQLLDLLWGGEETLIVVSSDLSHYHDYNTAVQRDRATTAHIESLDPHIDYGDACGRNPIRGLLLAAREHGLTAETVDLRNSGDTAGPKDRVVGYGAYVFH